MGDVSQYTLTYQQLLRDLKNTVEGLLVTQVANVWSIYGGLSRLHNTVEKVFKHGCKQSQEEHTYFNFIQGLEWLQPETSKSYFSIDCEYRPHIPPHLKTNKSSIWLYRSLENHSLSQKLSWLLSDKTHLAACYQSFAFFCQGKYAEATLICLKAVERNQPSLISDIDPCLFLMKNTAKGFHKIHRRCSSFPDNTLNKIYEEEKIHRRSTMLDNLKESNDTETKVNYKKSKNIQGKLKPWRSLPILQIEDVKSKEKLRIHSLSKTTPNTPVHNKKINKISPSLLKVDYSTLQSKKAHTTSYKKDAVKSGEVKMVLIDNCDIVEHTPPVVSPRMGSSPNDGVNMPETSKSNLNLAHSPLSVVDSFMSVTGEKDFKKLPKKSFIEDGGMSVLPMATGFFPQPIKGQSLLSFLRSSQFARANAELDRENAHFSISEAIISAMEQIRCKKDPKICEEHLDDSDPEIMDLKQRIRVRRRQKAVEKQSGTWASSVLNDGRTDTTSASPKSMTSESFSEHTSSEEIEDFEINETSNLKENSGLSISMASLYSESDLMSRPRGAPDGASDVLSAEGVALSLISKFNVKQLPRASDLEWLVSEEDAPQALLPLPKSWPVSPDDPVDKPVTPLRGTQEWAPPRPQLIFTLHPSPSRKELIAKQNYRCAGCGMRVAPQYVSRFRYCHYLGRYFCTGCHSNQLALIPARVLQKWDFSRYPVSSFSYRLLEQMYLDPLFRVFELNKNIASLSKNLRFCRRYCAGLHHLQAFIFTCKHAETIQERLQMEIPNLLKDPELFSMEDLENIKSGTMNSKLKVLVEVCCRHTSECKLCLLRGFICEICNAEEVIFPWQMRIVTRCEKCGNCYHSACWNSLMPCKKCQRIKKRKESLDGSSNI